MCAFYGPAIEGELLRGIAAEHRKLGWTLLVIWIYVKLFVLPHRIYSNYTIQYFANKLQSNINRSPIIFLSSDPLILSSSSILNVWDFLIGTDQAEWLWRTKWQINYNHYNNWRCDRAIFRAAISTSPNCANRINIASTPNTSSLVPIFPPRSPTLRPSGIQILDWSYRRGVDRVCKF